MPLESSVSAGRDAGGTFFAGGSTEGAASDASRVKINNKMTTSPCPYPLSLRRT